MPIDPNISLQFQQPKFQSPLEQYGNILQLKDLMAEGQLRNQQIAESQQRIKNEQNVAQLQEQKLADAKLFQDDLLKTRDWKTSLKNVEGRIAPSTHLAISEGYNKDVEQQIKNGSEQNKLDSELFAKFERTLGDLNGTDPKDRDAIYQQSLSTYRSDPTMGPVIEKAIQAGYLPTHYDKPTLDRAHVYAITNKAVLEEAEKRQQIETGKQTALTSKSNQLKLDAELKGVQADSDIKSRRAEMMKNTTPDQWDSMIDSAIDSTEHKQLNIRTRALVKLALMDGDLDKAYAAIKSGADHIAQTETSVATAKATAPIKIETAVATQEAKGDADMTLDDYRREGMKASITGVSPKESMGGQTINKGKLLHWINEFERNSGMSPAEVVTAREAFKGNAQSLHKLQTTRDMVAQAEGTAIKNIDVFLNAAKKAVDTGVPWINKPLQELDLKLFGSEDQAAINTGHIVSSVETAKVLGQITGTGSGVLSDSARHEAETLQDPASTLKQKYAAAKVILQDFKNRKQSITDTIAGITAEMKGSGKSTVQKWGRDAQGNPVMLPAAQ